MKTHPESTFKRNPLAASIRLEALTLGGVLASQLLMATAVSAGPTGEVIVGGSGSVSRMGSVTHIDQTSSHLAINWDTFNVGQRETVRFVQPSSSALVLNRILDQNPSRIRGSIDANGNVLLVNPRGILFTDTARVNVGGLVASGLDISVTDFMNGELLFKGVDGRSGAVVNQGVINASSAALIGKSVHNAADALISADLVTLAAGEEAVLTFDADGMLGVHVTKEVLENELGLDDALLNEGRIEGNKVLLTASVSRELFANAVNNGGVVTAGEIDVGGGTIRLKGSGDRISNTGTIRATGLGSSIAMEAGALANQGQISAQGAGDATSIRIDAGELHNPGTIASGAGGMAIEVGQAGKDSQHTLGQLTGAGDIKVYARGGASGTDSLSFAAGRHYQLGAGNAVSTQGITITGADRIDAGGEGRVQGRDDVADTFTITGNTTVQANATTFTNITSVAGGSGAVSDGVTGAAGWAMNGSNSVIAEGITFTGVEQVTATGSGQLTGQDGVGETFAVTGARALHTEGVDFANIAEVTGGGGGAPDRVTGAEYWQLNGSNSVVAAGITFSGIEQADSAAAGGEIRGRDQVAESFAITGRRELNADGIAFTNIEAVAAGDGAAVDAVTGADRWQLQGTRSVSAEGIVFSEVDQAGSETLESWVIGRDNLADAFAVTGDRMLTAEGTAFTNVIHVDAGSGAVVDQVAGATAWQLNGERSVIAGGITFTDIEAAGHATATSTLHGRAGTSSEFVITGNQALTTDGIAFRQIASVEAGEGNADHLLGTDEWALQGYRSVLANNITFRGIERAGSAAQNSRVTGQNHVGETFAITGTQQLHVQGIDFNKVTRVDAGEGAPADRVTGASEWLLNGQQSISAAGMVFNGIERAGSADKPATITGRDNAAETFVLNGSNALTVNDIAFTNITDVNAGTGAAQDRVDGASAWILNGNRSVRTEGITFTDVEQAEGAAAGSNIFARDEVAESFAINGHQSLRVDGISFSNIATVNAGAGETTDSVSGAGNWELQGSNRVRAQGILFKDIERVGGGATEISITGRDGVAESFVVTDSKRLTVDGMAFSNVAAVNAGGGAVADQVSGAIYWTLNGEKSVIAGGMAFSGVDQVSGSGNNSTLTGRSDMAETFILTGSKALTTHSMAFDNIAVVNAGSGSAPDRVSGSDDWLLNGNQSVKARDMTFYGVEEVGHRGDNSRVTGSANSTETFVLTGNNRVMVAGMDFDGISRISGQTADRVEDGGDLHYELQSPTEARVANIQLQGLALANIQWDARDSVSVASGHNLSGRAIDSKGAQLLGRQESDTFIVSGANTVDYGEVKFTNVMQVDGRGDQDTVTGAGEWALLGNRSVEVYGITFANIEQAGSAAADSQVRGRDGVAESFAIVGEKALSVDGIAFTNVARVQGGSGAVADSVSGSASWQLNGSRSLTAEGITFTDIEQAGTAGRAGILLGRNDVGEAFIITGEQALTVENIAFTHITTVAAGSGAAADQITGAADWALQGWQGVSAAGITFTGIEQAGQAGQENRITGRDGVGESFVIRGQQALTTEGIHFAGVTSVNAGNGGAADQVTGADQWQLTGPQAVNAAGMTFTGIEAAGSEAIPATLRGRNDVADAFMINGDRAVTANGIAFVNITSVEGGSGAADDRVSGTADWALNGHQSLRAADMLFTGIERADSVGSSARVLGRDQVAEAFAITGHRALMVDGITFNDIFRVDAGTGAATDSASGAAEWQLNGMQTLTAGGIIFAGIEQAVGADETSRVVGQHDLAETFSLTGPNSLAVDAIHFVNIDEVDAGSGAGDRVQSASNLVWELAGEQELLAGGIAFKAIEAAQHASGVSGYSRITGSAAADSFQVAGTREIIANGVRISAIDRVDASDNSGGSDVLTSHQIEAWQLSTDPSVQVEHSGIRFSGLEEVQGAMGSSLQGTAGNDHFIVGTEDNRVSRDKLTYSNINRIDGGAGEDTLGAGVGHTWQLTSADKQLVANGITYNNIDIAAATDATVKGRDGAAESFDIGSDPQQVRTQGMTFRGVARVDAGAGAGDSVVSHTAREWQLTGAHNGLQAAGTTFTGIEAATFSSAVSSPGSLRGSAANETFDISASQRHALSVNGIAFAGIDTVAAGGGHNRVVSADAEHWSLTGVHGEINAEDIRFTDVSSAGAKAGTAELSSLRGSEGDDTYVIDAQQQSVEVAGIRVDHLGNVDAGGGQDRVYNSRATQWRAAEAGGSWATQSAETLINSIWVLFANIEQVLNTGSYAGPASGADYTLTDTQAVKIGGIHFAGVSAIHAGSGVDTLYGLNLDTEWALNGLSGNTPYLTFTGIDTIRAGAARDIFTFSSGLAGDIDTGDGEDMAYLNGGSVAGLYLQGGADQVTLNSAASSVSLLDGGTGEDGFSAKLAGLTWQIDGDVNQVSYLGDGKLNYAFTGFENLRNSADDLRISTHRAAAFAVDQVLFEGAGIRLGYCPGGNVWLNSQYRGSNAVTGSVNGRSLDIRTAGDVDLHTRVDRLSILTQGGPGSDSLKIQVREADDLIIGQIYAGASGTISLTSMGLGALTAEARGMTHLKAGSVNLGSEWQRWAAIGGQMVPLRMEAGRSVNIVALSFVEPEFVHGSPSFMATGNRLQSVTGAVASQGMKSAVQTNVEQFTQVDPAIFTAVSPYSVHPEALNAPEYALVAGKLVPAYELVQSSGEIETERTTLKEEEE